MSKNKNNEIDISLDRLVHKKERKSYIQTGGGVGKIP
jgi:hypothetical protein